MFGPNVFAEQLRSRMLAKMTDQEEKGDGVATITTAFPKNPPPSGISYSRNFARFQKEGVFAQQSKD